MEFDENRDHASLMPPWHGVMIRHIVTHDVSLLLLTNVLRVTLADLRNCARHGI